MKEYSTRRKSVGNKDVKKVQAFLKKKFPSQVFTPEGVVKVATPKSSPIHKYFEWDDTEAARKYRLQQASHLIIAIAVEIEEGKPVKAYHSVVIDNQRVYTSIENVCQDEDLMDQVVHDAYRSLIHWKEQYKDFSEFKSVYKAIDTVKIKKGATNDKGKNKGKGKKRRGTSS